MIWHHWRHVIKPPYTIVDMFWHFSWMLLTSQRSRICQFYTLIWPDRVSNPHSTTHEEGTLTITLLMRFRFLKKLLVIFITINTFITYILFSCRMCVCFWFSVRGKLCTLSKWICIVSYVSLVNVNYVRYCVGSVSVWHWQYIPCTMLSFVVLNSSLKKNKVNKVNYCY
jgi:hypothetical protein